MSRKARVKSNTGIYHVVMRGINRPAIFEEHEDYERFLETMKKFKVVSEYKLYAYCLMSNHFHLLLKVTKEDLELIIKRIAGSYVYWYNRKYGRIGHLFQDRYNSAPIENEHYLLNALRYIHQNPLKAKICKTISEYMYSSYFDYVNEDSRLISIDEIYSIIDKESLIEFCNESNFDSCLDITNETSKMEDIDVLHRISNYINTTEFQNLEITQRNQFITKLRQNGLSIRQINRLTGVSCGIVRKL